MRKGMFLAAVAAVAMTGCGDDDIAGIDRGDLDPTQTMVLRLSGTAVGFTETLPQAGPGGETEGLCFTVDLIDASTGNQVGTATDCLSEITPVGDGLALIGTTRFDFDSGDSFTAQGLTSVQPKTHGSDAMTHVTGAIPAPGENGIVAGTGAFSNFRAEARLSGAGPLMLLNTQLVGLDAVSF